MQWKAVLSLVVALLVNPVQLVKAQAVDPALQRCTPSTQIALSPATAGAPQAADPDAASTPTLYVVTTVAPITNLAFNVGGNRIHLHGLIPEGADSHTFEPRPSDAQFLTQADLIFINGLHLEEPTRKLAEANLKPGAKIVELGALTLGEQDWAFDFSFPKDGGNPNPHLWMNPLLAMRYAAIMRDALVEQDPSNAGYYATNYEALSARLKALDQAICNAIASVPQKNRKLLTYHDSFAYFAPRYGMTVIGAIQPADFAEPSAREVARLIEQIKQEGVPAIFGSEVFPSKVLDQIGREAGVKYVGTLADDALPNQLGDRRYHSYLQLLVNDVTTMTEALGGDPSPLKDVPTDNLPGPDTAVEESGR